MKFNNDNLYKEGTVICAKVKPALKLIITKYRQRICYCSVLGHPSENHFAYFEKELIPPIGSLQNAQFVRVQELPSSEKIVF